MQHGGIWKFYMSFYKGLAGRLVFITLVAIIQACLLVPLALFVGHIFDQIVPQKNLNTLFFYSLGILGLYVSSHLLTLFNRYQTLKTTKKAIQRLRDELLQKIFKLSRNYYTQADRQYLHTVIVQDSERLDIMSNAIFATFIPSVLLSFFIGIVLFYLHPFLFAVLLVLTPLLYLGAKILGKKFHLEIRNFHKKFENFSSGISFVLKMLDLMRLQTAEETELTRQKGHHQSLRDASRKMAWLGTAYSVTQNFVMALTMLTILVLGGRSVIEGDISLGSLVAFFFAFGLFREHLQNVSQCIPELIAGQVSLKKLHDICFIPDEVPYDGKEKINFRGNISFNNVDFAYNEKPVLQNITLSVSPGKIFALVGPNGSGKSTILHLITGLYKPQSGEIKADQVSYTNLDIGDLRRQIGIILQDPMLFPGSLWDNITYGDKNYSKNEVDQAVKMATADDFISTLPLSYQTQIGENGVLLSGGQAQKIALARALVRKPSLLILDEPTNHLDSASIEKMMKNILNEIKSVTILVVSHDERVIRHCDEVVFLNEGKIKGAP